jgi:hypothetical protein
MTQFLTKDEIKRVSLGYNWYPNMSYEIFMVKNMKADDEVWDLIQWRYIEFFSNKNLHK